MKATSFRQKLAHSVRVTFRVRARQLAQGWSAGAHRAARNGSGIEFAGHRAYTPGDDLRHLDHHALLRHGRLLIREFHTDTERAVHLLVDVTDSMHYTGQKRGVSQKRDASQQRSKNGEAAETKAERALLLAAALAYLAHSSGDALGLSWIDSERAETIPPRLGNDWFERILHQLETLYERKPQHEKNSPAKSSEAGQKEWRRMFIGLGVALPRGTVIMALSDFLDLDDKLCRELGRLCSRRRSLRTLQILCDDEASFPFEGAIRLKDPETGLEIETDAKAVRAGYLQAFGAQTDMLRSNITGMGGEFERHLIEESPSDALRHLSLGYGR